MSAYPVLGSSQRLRALKVYGNPRPGQSFATFGKSKTVSQVGTTRRASNYLQFMHLQQKYMDPDVNLQSSKLKLV